MKLGLEGKIALVGGSSRGLGRAVAEELAAEGASLVLCARSPEPLARAGSELGGEINGGDHAVRSSPAFTGDIECRSVIGACPRKRQTQGDVNAIVESLEFERNQALVVIHAEDSVKFTLSSAEKDGVRRMRAGHDCEFRIGDCGL